MTGEAAGLLALLLVGHFLGDFTPLSTPVMLRAKERGRPLGPIAAHSAVHASLVALVFGLAVLVFGPAARPASELIVIAATTELVTHFAIDVGRGRLMGRFPPLGDTLRSSFWTLLGLDQLAHGLVLVGLVLLAI